MVTEMVKIHFVVCMDMHITMYGHMSAQPSTQPSTHRLDCYRMTHCHSGVLTVHRLPIPVISVGNLTWGGTGKTPMVEWISQYYLRSGVRPLVLMSGYGDDEWRQAAAHLPAAVVGVGRDRYSVAMQRIHEFASSNLALGVALLDDGMQHRCVHRDLEVVMVNCVSPFGNGYSVPAGSLREPPTALGRADVVVMHNAALVSPDACEHIRLTLAPLLKPDALLVQTEFMPSHLERLRDGAVLPLNSLSNGRVIGVAVAGVGSPRSFFDTVHAVAGGGLECYDFGDHHAFSPADCQFIDSRLLELRKSYRKEPVLLMSAKDMWRSRALFDKHLGAWRPVALRGSLRFTGRGDSDAPQALLNKLTAIHRSFKS